jgi:hypothetical protein
MCDTADFFRSRLDQMIDLRHPLAVLSSRMPWQELEASVSHLFAKKVRAGKVGAVRSGLQPAVATQGNRPQGLGGLFLALAAGAGLGNPATLGRIILTNQRRTSS